MRKVAIIQARMGSSRLPGKVLEKLAGKAVLQHVIERVDAAGIFDEIAVATTTGTIDDKLAEFAGICGATVVRGDEHDVLSRYAFAAEQTRADSIMRITADCPLIDPDILAAMAKLYDEEDTALVTNARIRTFPRGFDAEMFSRAALDIMQGEATNVSHREHVTPFLYENPERFSIRDYLGTADHSKWRLTLDTTEDLMLLQNIFGASETPEQLRLKDVLEILENRPEWYAINAHIEQRKV